MGSILRRRAVVGLAICTLAGAAAQSAVVASAQAASSIFRPYQAIAVPSEPDAVAVGDVTGDGRADVVYTTGYDGDPASDFHLFVMAQDAAGGLLQPVAYATAGTYPQRPGSVDLGDITGDGRTDVVVGLDRFGIQIFPGQADGTLGTPSLLLTADSTRIRVGQLQPGGPVEVAGIGWGSDTVTEFSDAGGGLAPVATYPARHDGWDDLDVGDVTGDGRADIVVMSGQGFVPNLSILPQLAGGGFGPAAEYSVGGNVLTQGIGLGDVTGDGRSDVVASYGGNRPSSSIAVFAQTATGTLAAPISYPSYDIPEPVEIADLDRDGRNDAVTLHGGWNAAGTYRGLADGTFAPELLDPVPYASHYSVHGLAVGDVDGDGWPDVVAADYNNGIVILRNRAVVQPTPPGAPILTSAAPADGRITVGWTTPGSDGGSPVTGYTATASPGGATCSTSTLSCTIIGLTNGTTYLVTVLARNVVGPGPASNPLSAIPGVAPSTPRSLAASPNLPAGIGLTWQPPASSGSSPVASYRIYRGPSGGLTSLLATVGNVTAYTDAAVVNGGSYVYEVAAVNGFGEGPRSAPIPTQRGTAPSAPRSVAATTGAQGITITWQAPSSNGGSPVTGYRIVRSTSSGAETFLVGVGSGSTSYVDKSVAKKTRYFYQVSAVSTLGEGPRSPEVSAVSK